MSQSGVIAAYERILRGEQSGFSPYEFQPQERKQKIIELIRYLVEERWKTTPEEVLKEGRMTVKALTEEKLDALLRYVEKSPEQSEEDASHLLYFAYPDLPKPSLYEVVTKVYREVLEGKRKNFPRQYFVDPELGEERAIICFRYLCEEVLHLKPQVVSLYFEGRSNALLRKYKLKILLNVVYDSFHDLLEAAYPSVQEKEAA